MPRLLDLFCGGGGAAMGYHRAGFDVVGVDIAPQPRYPFEFHQADALTYPLDGFDVVHASPPCQRFTAMATLYRQRPDRHPDLLTPTLDRLAGLGVPWVVENVSGRDVAMAGWWLTLCGSSFGLGVRRHRRFGSSVALLAPPCRHDRQPAPVGVYGHAGGSSSRRPLEQRHDLAAWSEAMGAGWMTTRELAQAIPPAYTEHLGRQLVAALEGVAT